MKWDPIDLLACLEVEPHRDVHGVEHSYSVSRRGLRLVVTVFQYDGDVYFSLFRDDPDGQSILDLKIKQCPEILFRKFGGDECLEFFPGRTVLESFDKTSSITSGVRVRIHPDIRLELFRP
jgi:hypothetical protein